MAYWFPLKEVAPPTAEPPPTVNGRLANAPVPDTPAYAKAPPSIAIPQTEFDAAAKSTVAAITRLPALIAECFVAVLVALASIPMLFTFDGMNSANDPEVELTFPLPIMFV